MTFLPIVGDDDVRTREEQIAFLRAHRRYHTMNSWNNATSYAHCIKIDHLDGLSREDRDRCYDGLACEQAFFNFNDEIFIFGVEHKGWCMGTNGRSGGYLVLYRREGDKVYPGRGLDMDEDFAGWGDEDIAARVEEVRRFDEACESAVAAYVDFCRTHKFVDKTRMVPEKYVGAEEVT
jgi:hypothetical protein